MILGMGHETLEEFLEANDPIREESLTDGIRGNDDEEAGRMLRTLRAVEQRIAANADRAATERAKITGWETAVNGPLQAQAIRLRESLEGYALAERARDEKTRKTISTPFGVIKTLPAQSKWTVEDEAAVIEWAKAAGQEHLIETTTKAKLTAIKKDLLAQDGQAIDSETGDIVPGIKITAAERPFTVTIKTN
jgi:phage host-nuclease inhibitor protein Gam